MWPKLWPGLLAAYTLRDAALPLDPKDYGMSGVRVHERPAFH